MAAVSTVSSVNRLAGVSSGKSLVFVQAPSWTEPITSPAIAPIIGWPPPLRRGGRAERQEAPQNQHRGRRRRRRRVQPVYRECPYFRVSRTRAAATAGSARYSTESRRRRYKYHASPVNYG